jgi:signal transduction histidine kinase
VTSRPVGVLGLALSGALAWGFGAPAADVVQLTGLAALAAAATGTLAAIVLHRARGLSVAVQATVVSLVAVVATAVGVVAASSAMFISSHDLWALLVVLVAAGAIAIVFALLLGARVGEGSRAVSELVRDLGSEQESVVSPRGAPSEFARLGAELAATRERLDEARSRERALDSSRRELVAWVSHDLRTPIAGIRAMAEALEDHVVDDPASVQRYYSTIRKESERLSALVDDLFELSRINSGTLQLTIERVPFEDLVSDALSAASPAASSKGVKLEGRLATSGVVELSTPEVLRALRNVLDNAIHHTPADGSVVVEAEVDGQRAVVSVRDSCGGIPASDIDRVFDLAFRGDGARSRDGGAGIGLAIARGIVEAHHGAIAVVNEDAGCRFTVELPVTQQS